MSAPHIPNLLGLRGGLRGRARGRGRGRGNGRGGQGVQGPDRDLDNSVQQTDTDAAVSRLSAVNLGFLDDPFSSYFVRGEPIRRLPIINRGTYTRTTALDKLIEAFIDDPSSGPDSRKQIISLGAGTDTRYFRLRAKNKHQNVIYHEFDFPSVCLNKINTVIQNPTLTNLSPNESIFPDPTSSAGFPGAPFWPRHGPFTIRPGEDWGINRVVDGKSETIYSCHSLDLRELLTREREFEELAGLRADLPTLIISECCLCYLEVHVSREVINWLTARISSLGLILYEPIGPDDSFGQMMVSNLAARNITMPSLSVYKTLQDQIERLEDLGFGKEGHKGGKEAKTIYEIWEKWIDPEEKERLDGLDGLDEVEEWEMLARHYAVAWGWIEAQSSRDPKYLAWEGWKNFLSPSPTP